MVLLLPSVSSFRRFFSDLKFFVLIWLSCQLLFDVARAAEYDYTVKIPPSKIECYFQAIDNPNHVTAEIDYMVIDGGPDMDITVIVKDPERHVILTDLRRRENTRKFPLALKGDYEICFDNSFSFTTAKTVYFEIVLMDKDGSADEIAYEKMTGTQALAKEIEGTLESFRLSGAKIKNNLNQAEQFQSQLRGIEFRDRAMMEDNFDRVNFWSVINLICMLCCSVLQVFLIRSLFEEHPRLRKLVPKGWLF